MCLAVDPPGHPADDDEPGRRELAPERPRDRPSVRRAGASADDRDRRFAEQLRRRLSPQPEHGRRVGDHPQKRRIRRHAAVKAANVHADAPRPASGTRAPRRDARAARHRRPPELRSCARRARREPGPFPTVERARRRGRAARTPPPFGEGRHRRAAAPFPPRLWPSRRRGLTRWRREFLCSRPRHRDDEIEPIEQRPRHLLAVGRDALRAAATVGGRISPAPARTQVHRRDQTEPGRKQRVTTDARDRDDTVLERLPERLENRARELRELVEQEHSAVGKARFSRPRARRRRRRSRPPTLRGAVPETAASA